MRKFIARLSLILVIGGLIATPIVSQAHIPSAVNGHKVASLAPMLAKTTSAVVNITVEKVLPAQPSLSPQSRHQRKFQAKAIAVGSGVIINAQHGLIVTNAHVVRNQRIMIVTLKDGRRYHARLIGKDPAYDIAVIQIHAKHLQQIAYGNSAKLHVGDFVVAIGSPFGLTQTVTSGVISALNRDTPRIEGYQDFIQTDASINPGNSGGALLNTHGQLIGINTAIIAPNIDGNIGIGFAIPSNMVKSVADQLIRYGKVSRGVLGVYAQNITPQLADALQLKNDRGVLVTQVAPHSPAQQAGIKSEDIITKVNDNPINSAAQLRNMMGVERPGTAIKLEVVRNHKVTIAHATVASPKTLLKKQQVIPFLNGLRLTHFSDLEPNGTLVSGALVAGVKDSSAGALAGLLPGDVIISVNGHPINSVNDLVKVAKSGTNQLLLKVSRGVGKVFLVISKNQ